MAVKTFLITDSMICNFNRNNMLANLEVQDSEALGVHLHVTPKQSI